MYFRRLRPAYRGQPVMLQLQLRTPQRLISLGQRHPNLEIVRVLGHSLPEPPHLVIAVAQVDRVLDLPLHGRLGRRQCEDVVARSAGYRQAGEEDQQEGTKAHKWYCRQPCFSSKTSWSPGRVPVDS